ncbi:hypothetical protein ACPCUV_01380 [Streptomyces platensis]|uniref:hypothetical protein n=1 Tax=Streptomyces platensis TaxID=58346 RepID=UPI003C2BE8DA
MRTEKAGTPAPLRLLFIGGRPALRRALEATSRAVLVNDPAEATCALVDVASLTPTAHAAACHYPLAPSLPLIIISALGADTAAHTNAYLAEVARAEHTAAQAHTDHCVLRCAPMDVDLAQVARQIEDFSTVYGCFSGGRVPWLAVEDLIDVAATVAAEPERRAGRVYEITGHESATVATAVGLLASAMDSRADYHVLEPAQLVDALCVSVGWSLDMALRVPHQQEWIGTEQPTSPLVERALGRPPRPLEACVAHAAASAAGPTPESGHSAADQPATATKGTHS